MEQIPETTRKPTFQELCYHKDETYGYLNKKYRPNTKQEGEGI